MISAIWTAMYAECPLHDALRALHSYGWLAFEISTEHLVAIQTDRDPDSLIEKAQESKHILGISTLQAHAYLNADIADPDTQKRERDIKRLLQHIDIAARLGVLHVVIHPGGGTIDWPAVMDAFREVDYMVLFNLEIPGERHAVYGLRQLKTRFALDVSKWLVGLIDSAEE